MKKLLLALVILFLFSCKNATEPELSYTTIQYHQSEIVGGLQIWYVDQGITLEGDITAFVDDMPPGTNFAIGKWIRANKDFTLNDKKFRSRDVKEAYIEIASY